MRLTKLLRLSAATVITAAIGLVATGSIAGASDGPGELGAHAVFVETDAATNTVLSYSRGPNGALTYVGTFATGGAGATAANAKADPLASQSGLVLVNDGRELLAVNPGSDTVSVFGVDGANLRLIGQVPSQGQFPDSIASRGNLVAVLNAGGTGDVAEFRLLGPWLVAVPGGVRGLGLANSNPPDFVHGPGQVGFSPDGRFLVVTTKGSTNAYDVFSVGWGGWLSASPKVTPAQNAVPFAFSFDAAGHLVGVEASNSSLSTYSINADGSLTPIGTVQDGEAALCWISSARGYFFGSNAGSGNVTSFGVASNGTPSVINAAAGTAQPGTTDSAASPDGRFLYVEAGGSGDLDVFAVSSNGTLTALQTLTGLPTPFEGIAVS